MPLPIHQYIGRIIGISRTKRSLLARVVSLAENGDRGYCNAKNDYLAKEEQMTVRSVTRLLAESCCSGLLVIKGHTKSRRMVASPALRACYASATKQACQAATDELSKQLARAKMAKAQHPLPLDNSASALAIPGHDLTTNDAAILDISGRAYKETKKKEKEEVKHDNPAADAESLGRAEKKIRELTELVVQTNERHAAERAADSAMITTLQAQLRAAHTEARATSPPAAVSTSLPYSTPAFDTCWGELRKALSIASNSPRERALLDKLNTLAATEHAALAILHQTIRKGWKDLYEIDESRSSTPSSFGQRAHAERGQKPTGNAGLGARALAERAASLHESNGRAVAGSVHSR